jgi:hypothetical protein
VHAARTSFAHKSRTSHTKTLAHKNMANKGLGNLRYRTQYVTMATLGASRSHKCSCGTVPGAPAIVTHDMCSRCVLLQQVDWVTKVFKAELANKQQVPLRQATSSQRQSWSSTLRSGPPASGNQPTAAPELTCGEATPTGEASYTTSPFQGSK